MTERPKAPKLSSPLVSLLPPVFPNKSSTCPASFQLIQGHIWGKKTSFVMLNFERITSRLIYCRFLWQSDCPLETKQVLQMGDVLFLRWTGIDWKMCCIGLCLAVHSSSEVNTPVHLNSLCCTNLELFTTVSLSSQTDCMGICHNFPHILSTPALLLHHNHPVMHMYPEVKVKQPFPLLSGSPLTASLQLWWP